MSENIDIYIRPLCLEDAKTSYIWRNNPKIWEKTGSRPDREVTLEMEIEWIQRVIAEQSSRRFAICIAETGQYVGNIYLINVNFENKTAEQATFIGEIDYWGKGIASVARQLLSEYAKNELKLNKLVSRVREDNIASIKSNLKLGFEVVGSKEGFVNMERFL